MFRGHIQKTGYNYCLFILCLKLNYILLVWNTTLEVCPQHKWVVFEDREKDASLMNFDIDPYQTGYIKH